MPVRARAAARGFGAGAEAPPGAACVAGREARGAQPLATGYPRRIQSGIPGW